MSSSSVSNLWVTGLRDASSVVVLLLLFHTDIDHLLAQHMAHLFIRDPVSLFSEKIHQNDETETDHFEVRQF